MQAQRGIRGGIALGQAVDVFLNPHRVRVNQIAIAQVLLQDFIGCGVSVQGESGQGVFVGVDKRVDAIVSVVSQRVSAVVGVGRAAGFRGDDRAALRGRGGHCYRRHSCCGRGQ